MTTSENPHAIKMAYLLIEWTIYKSNSGQVKENVFLYSRQQFRDWIHPKWWTFVFSFNDNKSIKLKQYLLNLLCHLSIVVSKFLSNWIEKRTKVSSSKGVGCNIYSWKKYIQLDNSHHIFCMNLDFLFGINSSKVFECEEFECGEGFFFFLRYFLRIKVHEHSFNDFYLSPI